jgi:hypothetical protein
VAPHIREPDAGQPSDEAGATPRIVEDVVAPLAEAEAAWRESLRDPLCQPRVRQP